MIHEFRRCARKRSQLLSAISVPKFVRALVPAVAFILWCAGHAGGQESADISRALRVAAASAPLTIDERNAAVSLAVEALKSARLFTTRRMYLAEIHVSRDAASEMRGGFGRRAMLTYYRYEGDLTIRVLIDLARRRVLEIKQLPQSFAPISTEEAELAKTLALNHPQLGKDLRPHRDSLVIEVLTLRTTLPRNPLFRHRVVRLLFRSGSTYLVRHSRVLVDLTTEKVIIEPASGGPSMR